MADSYYKPCKELDMCRELIAKYWDSKEYGKLFAGHLPLAEAGYPLAECQVGYFYREGLGVERDPEKSFNWTRRAAEHGDRDGQFNLGLCYEEGAGTACSMELAARWYAAAARQGHDLALKKCRELGIDP